MPDDELTQETPAVEQPDTTGRETEGTPGEPEESTPEDYEARYKETQAAYTQSQQELAEYREYMEKLQSDETERRALLAELADEYGYHLPDDEDDYKDPVETLAERVERLEQERQEAQQRYEEDQQWEKEAEKFQTSLKEYEQKSGTEFTKDEIEFAGARIILEGADPKEVFSALDRLGQARYERILNKKKAPRAPSGKPGSPTLDHKNRDEVEEAAREAAAEALAHE